MATDPADIARGRYEEIKILLRRAEEFEAKAEEGGIVEYLAMASNLRLRAICLRQGLIVPEGEN